MKLTQHVGSRAESFFVWIFGVEPRIPGSDVDFFCGVFPFPTQLGHKPWGQQKLLKGSVQCLRHSGEQRDINTK